MYTVYIMTKTRSFATVERETVASFLARGGQITYGPSSLPNDLVRLSESDRIDMLLGASYDDLFGSRLSNFYVPGDTLATIRETQDHQNAENDYDE